VWYKMQFNAFLIRLKRGKYIIKDKNII